MDKLKNKKEKALLQAIDEVLDGELLFYEKNGKFYYDTTRIYGRFAGYRMDWSEFIGYQNIRFYKNVECLKKMASYRIVGNSTDFWQRQMYEISVLANRINCSRLKTPDGDYRWMYDLVLMLYAKILVLHTYCQLPCVGKGNSLHIRKMNTKNVFLTLKKNLKE